MMADNTLNSCLNESFRSSSDNALPKRDSRRKFCGYHYVPSESDEADTLKDKFWRDLEQGKLNFLNTVDMYTRVKRPGKLSGVECFTVSSQDPVQLSDTAAVTCLQSSMPSSSVFGSLTCARDASPPSSSGYESSSIPSIGSVSVSDSPTESDQRLGGSCDLFANVAWSEKPVLKRKRKTSGKCIWQSSVKSKRRKLQTAPRKPSSKKKTNSRFFTYVDALSEEADTLKDKFWRDLELGNVSAITTTDLYSSVKVSRRTRQLSFSSVINSDQAEDFTELPVTSRESQANDTMECTEVSAVGVRCSETEVSSCNRKSDSSVLNHPSDCYISEQMAGVADCKLLSPCSVSVERLPFSVDGVDLLVEGTAERYCRIVADNSNCMSAEKQSHLITDDRSIVTSYISVTVDCKRWHSGRCRTGLRHLNEDTYAVECISGSNTHVDSVRLHRLEINSSLPVCHVPLPFQSTCQRVISGWLEDDAVADAGEVLGCFGNKLSMLFAVSFIINITQMMQ